MQKYPITMVYYQNPVFTLISTVTFLSKFSMLDMHGTQYGAQLCNTSILNSHRL